MGPAGPRCSGEWDDWSEPEAEPTRIRRQDRGPLGLGAPAITGLPSTLPRMLEEPLIAGCATQPHRA